MFTPLDILLGAAGVLVAVGICAPFLMLRSRAARHPRPAPAPARVARELQKQAS